MNDRMRGVIIGVTLTVTVLTVLAFVLGIDYIEIPQVE